MTKPRTKARVSPCQGLKIGQVNLKNEFDLGSRERSNWTSFKTRMKEKEEKERIGGISYVISGSLALVGGFIGQGQAVDPLEIGIYALFQTIGIASLGYGVHVWRVGDEERLLFNSLENAHDLNDRERGIVISSYLSEQKQREKSERFIRALTHGLIAAYNVYNASHQSQESVSNVLYFIGGVNLLACASYSF